MFWACLGEMDAYRREEAAAYAKAREEAQRGREPGSDDQMLRALQDHETRLAAISGVPSPFSLN